MDQPIKAILVNPPTVYRHTYKIDNRSWWQKLADFYYERKPELIEFHGRVDLGSCVLEFDRELKLGHRIPKVDIHYGDGKIIATYINVIPLEDLDDYD